MCVCVRVFFFFFFFFGGGGVTYNVNRDLHYCESKRQHAIMFVMKIQLDY